MKNNVLKLRKSDKSAAIDSLFLANNTISIMSHPPLMLYFIANQFLFPMSNYIGIVGCVFLMHFLDVYIRVCSLYFPLTVALLRYLLVVQHKWVKSVGLHQVVLGSIVFSLVIPLFMTAAVQYPIADFIHGPFNHCIGRFEVYFNPTHSDPFTPGRREGGRHCDQTILWALETNLGMDVLVILVCTQEQHVIGGNYLLFLALQYFFLIIGTLII